MKILPRESVIVLSEGKEKIADALAAACEARGAKVRRATVALKHHRQEPPKNIEYALMECHAAFLATEHSLTHTDAVRRARLRGIRIASMPGIDEEMFERAVNTNYPVMRNRAQRVSQILAENDSLVISSSKGTSVRLKRGGRKIMVGDGYVREDNLINLPEGEVYFAPIEESVSGKIAADGCGSPDTDGEFGKIGLIREPIILTIKEGRVMKIEGGRQAEILQKYLSALNDPGAYRIAEFGIGINPKARITGKILESEKSEGSIHFALGENRGFYGKNASKIHWDFVVRQPKIFSARGNLLLNENILKSWNR